MKMKILNSLHQIQLTDEDSVVTDVDDDGRLLVLVNYLQMKKNYSSLDSFTSTTGPQYNLCRSLFHKMIQLDVCLQSECSK